MYIWREYTVKSMAVESRHDGSALRQALQVGVELGERDGGAFGVADHAGAFGEQGGDGEGHGDAVVVVAREAGAVEALLAGDEEAVGADVAAGAHGGQVRGDGGDAVAFLDPQLAHVLEVDAVAGGGGEYGEDGHLVNQRHGLFSG